jgi:uncharacterized protein YbaR (Trm112 family)
MSDELLASLRCPIDPNRQATLTRNDAELSCSSCSISFPIKNGIPILVPDSARLPDGLREISQLPCQRRENRRVNRDR